MFGEKRHNVKMQGCTLLCRNEAKYPTLEKLQLLTSISQLPTAAQLPKETHCCCILLCAVLTKTECKKFLCCISKVASSSGFGPYHNLEMSRYPSMQQEQIMVSCALCARCKATVHVSFSLTLWD